MNDEATWRAEAGNSNALRLIAVLVVPEDLLPQVLDAIQRAGATGRSGDGKIFVTRVEQAIRIQSGESGAAVL